MKKIRRIRLRTAIERDVAIRVLKDLVDRIKVTETIPSVKNSETRWFAQGVLFGQKSMALEIAKMVYGRSGLNKLKALVAKKRKPF